MKLETNETARARRLGSSLLVAVVWWAVGPGFLAGSQAEPVGLRLILVESEAEAVEIRSQIQAGMPFEVLARERSRHPSAGSGGYLGAIALADLRREYRDALSDVEPGQVSPVARTADGYVLLQRMSAEDASWRAKHDRGLQSLQRGRLVEAAELLNEAIEQAEQLGPEDYRLGESLNSLAAIYRLQGDYVRAEPLYERTLSIRERTLGPMHPDVAATLNNLAEARRFLGDYAGAEPLYRRSLSILEETLGAEHPNVAQSLNNLGQLLHAQSRYSEAETLFRRSLTITEQAPGAGSLDLATGLYNLAQTIQEQQRYGEAEPLYRRSLALLEEALGSAHPNVAQTLASLAEVVEAGGDDDEADRLYRRSLAIRWGRPSATGPSDVTEVVDKFAAALRLAYFLDERFKEAFGEYEEVIAEAPIGEDLYRVMSAVFVEVARKEEAEAVMLRAVERYPLSWRSRYELGEVYVQSMKLQSALEAMETAVGMRSDPAPDRRQQSFLYRRIGDIRSELLRFEDAETAYRQAVELDPGSLESQLALADSYLSGNKLEEALAAYTGVVSENPSSAQAYTGLAEVNLRLRRFPESVAAADRALEIDPDIQIARYHRARALIQMGQREEGQAELQSYQTLQAEDRSAEDLGTTVYVSNRDAADKLIGGQGEEAIRLFREGIESHPEEPAFYFNLGVAQSLLGRHEDAVDTLQGMIDMGIGDDFLTHWSLSREYEALGDALASERHRTLYLGRIEAELRSRLR